MLLRPNDVHTRIYAALAMEEWVVFDVQDNGKCSFGDCGCPTLIQVEGKSSAEDIGRMYAEGKYGADRYSRRRLLIAPLKAFSEVELEPDLVVHAASWQPFAEVRP